MLVVLVLADPTPGSFSHHLSERAGAGLRAGSHEVIELDLCELGFRVEMTAEERAAYHGDEPICDPMVAEHVEIIQRADAIVFIYPTWSSGVPAILKGWFERVMVPGVAFRFDDRTGKVRPALGNVRHIIGISTYNSSRATVRAMTDSGRRTITRAFRVNTGFKTRTRWFGFYDLATSTEAQRSEFAAHVEREMADLR
ncbi:MAG: flavodoxin family protein [Actinobacteria bacterium]|nr:MAG: flavodoxin family protein [Actinomycetota bacterium]